MEHLDFATDLARAAGSILREYQRCDKQVELKGRANLVTIADRESEALLVREIRSRYPEHSILTEESGTLGPPGEDRWIIDPLDGTTNFAHQYPFYCVSIGFERNGRVVCGVVYDPLRDELFRAARGVPPTLNGDPIRVSTVPSLRDSLLMTGFSYAFREKIETVIGQFRAFMIESQAVRRGGSAALDLCYVACGRVEGFWELDLHPWDTAAALVIAEEAGARVTDFRGRPYSVYLKEILASNGGVHDEMLGVLQSTGRPS